MKDKKPIIVTDSIKESQMSDDDIDMFFDSAQSYSYEDNQNLDIEDNNVPSFSQDNEFENDLKIEDRIESFEKQSITETATPNYDRQLRSYKNSEEKDDRNKAYKEIKKPIFEDVLGFLDYDDQERKKKNFVYEYEANEFGKETSEELKENFKDFLVMKKITGKSSGFKSSSYYPVDRLIDVGQKIKIFDDKEFKQDSPSSTTKVVVHKSEEGIVEKIEINCKCGEIIIVDLDYSADDNSDEIFSEVISDEISHEIKDIKQKIEKPPKKINKPIIQKNEIEYENEGSVIEQDENKDVYFNDDSKDEQDKGFVLDFDNLEDDEDDKMNIQDSDDNDDDDLPLLTIEDLKDI